MPDNCKDWTKLTSARRVSVCLLWPQFLLLYNVGSGASRQSKELAAGSSSCGHLMTSGSMREPRDRGLASLGFWNHQSHSNQVIPGGPSGGLNLQPRRINLNFPWRDSSQPWPRELFWDTWPVLSALVQINCPHQRGLEVPRPPSFTTLPGSVASSWLESGRGLGFSKAGLGGVGPGSRSVLLCEWQCGLSGRQGHPEPK